MCGGRGEGSGKKDRHLDQGRFLVKVNFECLEGYGGVSSRGKFPSKEWETHPAKFEMCTPGWGLQRP